MRCILFDLDGTLYQSAEYFRYVDDQTITLVAEKLHWGHEQAATAVKVGKLKYGTLTRTLSSLGIDREEFFNEITNRIDAKAYLSPDISVSSLIQDLKGQGFKVGLVSNSGRLLVEKVLAAIGLTTDLFDAVVTSSDAAPKPSQEPFLLAIRRTGSDVKDAIYVGDRDEQELRPAKELGMATILLASKSEPSRWADYVISTLTELPSAVESWTRKLSVDSSC